MEIELSASGTEALATHGQVSQGLNLTLELKHPLQMPLLLGGIKLLMGKTRAALQELHFVHFARFLPVRGNTALLVITEFDGPLQAYVMDFVIAIGDVFTLILSFVKDAPPLPVQRHPREFWNFIQANNRVVVLPPLLQWDENYPLYSAYPQRTVIDILGPRKGLPPPVQEPAASDIDLADVQANIVRGLHAQRARHYALTVQRAAGAADFLATLVDGDGVACPRLTSAQPWERQARPSYFLTVGFTAAGLQALGVTREVLERFGPAFVEGPAQAARAQANGDVGDSAPRHWELGGAGSGAHLLVSLYGDHDTAEFGRRDRQLREWFDRARLTLVIAHDAQTLPDDRVHFGYRDGIAQPRLAAPIADPGADMQPRASVGEFLLGANYLNIYGAPSIGDLPGPWCENATFAAVRLLDQNVGAFEELLDHASAAHGVDREWIAAKLMGRWRDGTPLSLAPTMTPPHAVADHNEFDYAPSSEHPHTVDDQAGLRCPAGAHIRRLNPRSSLVAGRPHSRRLIRRGMPYGPVWDERRLPGRRGLYGIFICADLERQFEFLNQVWANSDISTTGVRGTLDPIVGAQPEPAGLYRIPMPDGNGELRLNVPRLVTTRGSLYLLMPGLNGVRHLASMAAAAEGDPHDGLPTDAGHATAAFDPRAFDPKDPSFLADPYPWYAQFRAQAPVALVRHGSYASHWVFRHDLVTQVCQDGERFLKRPVGESGERGLFYMDPPRHETVRGILNPLFARATRDIASVAAELADEALADIRRGGATFELVTRYAERVTRNVFMTMFGLPRAQWQRVGELVNTVLQHYDPMLPLLQRAPAAVAGAALLGYFWVREHECPARPAGDELLCLMQSEGKSAGMLGGEVTQTALHFALGGYLSTQFLIGTGLYNLLIHPGALQAYRGANPAKRAQAIDEMRRYDAPFQMADRFAAVDLRLGDCDVRAGSMVTVVYGSANRDERVFGPHAERFDLDRRIDPGTNYVFGHGIHTCIGAPMAEQVAAVVFDRLIDAFPQLRLGDRLPTRLTDPYYRAVASLELWR